MKVQLRYCDLEIADKFEGDIEHSFEIEEHDPDNGPVNMSIDFKILTIDWKDINAFIKQKINSINGIDSEIIYDDNYLEDIIIDGINAKVTYYKLFTNNRYDIYTLCYIPLKNKQILEIQGFTFNEEYFNKYFKNNWQQFYNSYRLDLSQNYKTFNGSFQNDFNNFKDFSRFIYSFSEYNSEYKLEFNYRPESKEEYESTIISGVEDIALLFPKASFDITKNVELKIKDREAINIETTIARPDGLKVIRSVIFFYNLNPGLEIVIEGGHRIFERYKEEMDYSIENIDFYD